MIKRKADYYTAGFRGEDPEEAPLYMRSLVFDGSEGDFNVSLVNGFNRRLEKDALFKDYSLAPEGGTAGRDAGEGTVPGKIIVVNASHDNLPTSYETARIFEQHLSGRKLNIPVTVVNTKEELLRHIEHEPEKTLLVSQCVDKKVYDAALAEGLEKMGAVTVPGRVTAPGGVFSDKDSTYKLLSDNGTNWDSVARYKKVPVENAGVEQVVDGIFQAVEEIMRNTGDDVVFIKPHEGGGGLGGFRLIKRSGGYIIPDLSKVSGDVSEIHPTYIDINIRDRGKLRELLWIYRLFDSDEKMRSNYLHVDLGLTGADDDEALDILKVYLDGCMHKREKKLSGMVLNAGEAKKKVTEAVRIFEEKFKRRYVPLVNEHIDFGLWGLRAHYRMSRRGPVLETIYSRIFQLAFTEEGVGYLGSDNISNKQTGELEVLRLGPINKIMVEAIGGEEILYRSLVKGVSAMAHLARLLSEEDRKHVPLRLQLDLAALSQRIGEGNADTARGLCLASRWSEFVRNNTEWIEDSLAYYAWRKKG